MATLQYYTKASSLLYTYFGYTEYIFNCNSINKSHTIGLILLSTAINIFFYFSISLFNSLILTFLICYIYQALIEILAYNILEKSVNIFSYNFLILFSIIFSNEWLFNTFRN